MTKVTQLSLDQEGGLNRRRIHLREISGDADTPLETVGQDLRAARLRRGDDLASVSRALKIRKDHLEALEEDRFEQLPGRAYAIGFVRSYADYLGIDPVQCVERFKLEIAGRGDSALPTTSLSGIEEDRQLPHGWLIIAGVILLLIGYGGYRLVVSADSLVNQPVAAVPQQFAPKPPAKVMQKKATPKATPFSAPPPGASVTQTQSAAAPSEAATSPAQSATPPPANTEVASLPPGTEYGQQNKSARVILRIREPTHILVEGADGRVFVNRTLQAGDTYRVPLIQGVTLTAQNGKAVELDLDGQAMGTASNNNGAVEGFSLDPQSVADHAGDPG